MGLGFVCFMWNQVEIQLICFGFAFGSTGCYGQGAWRVIIMDGWLWTGCVRLQRKSHPFPNKTHLSEKSFCEYYRTTRAAHFAISEVTAGVSMSNTSTPKLTRLFLPFVQSIAKFIQLKAPSSRCSQLAVMILNEVATEQDYLQLACHTLLLQVSTCNLVQSHPKNPR